MKMDVSTEQRFIAEVDAFEFVAADVEAHLHALESWLVKLQADLQAGQLIPEGITERSALARQASGINTFVREAAREWSQQLASLEATRSLADSFDDKAMLLVFGKFNAGKSSFCNFLAERFAAHHQSVRYFHIDAGRIVETSEPFTEGSTETTSRLQGVRLGEKLVLLDTPGLHSVTPENAELTQRFTDSADAVLWLTSSTSPGQVQELDELGRELHRNKPLLPVVTRSDEYDEDEVDGELVRRLCNKSAQRRSLQELDISTRAGEKLRAMDVDVSVLKTPVSISAYVAREQGQTPEAMTDAGFDKLYAALLAITEPALAYKRRKQAEILLHHLEENVLGTLHGNALPLLADLSRTSQTALASLAQLKEQIANAVWRRVMPTLPELLETHAPARDVNTVCAALAQSTFNAFGRVIDEVAADYMIEPDASLAQIRLDDDAGYEDIVIGQTGTKDSVSGVVEVDYGRLYSALMAAIQETLMRLSAHAIRQCHASIQNLTTQIERLEDSLKAYEHDLIGLKSKVRSEPA